MTNLEIILVLLAAVALVVVIPMRRRSQRRFLDQYSEKEVCEHLRPALEALKARGHQVVRAGQRAPEMPLEIHVAPHFDPQALADELKLKEPVMVSARNVLYCREHWCELHPIP